MTKTVAEQIAELRAEIALARDIIYKFNNRWQIDRGTDGALVWINRFRDEDGPPEPLTADEEAYLETIDEGEYLKDSAWWRRHFGGSDDHT